MRKSPGRGRILRVAAGALLGLWTMGLSHAQEISPSQFSEMNWRMIGPFPGRKVNAAAGATVPALMLRRLQGGGYSTPMGSARSSSKIGVPNGWPDGGAATRARQAPNNH